MRLRILITLLQTALLCVAADKTIQWSDLAKGAKLPHGTSVTLTGRLSDLQCGSVPIPSALDVTGISISDAGQTIHPIAGTISGSTWSATLGPLPPSTALRLQMKITGSAPAALSALTPACTVSSDAPGNQGVQLTQPLVTQDLTKYAGFDAAALAAPRINELRQFYMMHIYPWGPVELDTTGHVPFAERWSFAIGASAADLSANANSPIKNGKAFAYGVGFRLNKYFRLSAGLMLYRDSSSNRLMAVPCYGPSIDITALPGLTSIFSQ
jgi:hypothetical protein